MSIEKQAGPFRRLQRLLEKRDRLIRMSEPTHNVVQRYIRDNKHNLREQDLLDLRALTSPKGRTPIKKGPFGQTMEGSVESGSDLLFRDMKRQLAALKKPISKAETRAASMLQSRPSLKPLLKTTKIREGEKPAEHALRVVRGERFMDDARKIDAGKIPDKDVVKKMQSRVDLESIPRDRQRALLQQVTTPTEKQQAQAVMQDLFNRQRRGILPRPKGSTKAQDEVTRSRVVTDRTKLDTKTNKRVLDPSKLSPEEQAVYEQAQLVLRPKKSDANLRTEMLDRYYPSSSKANRSGLKGMSGRLKLKDIARDKRKKTTNRTIGEDKLLSAANREVLYDASKRLDADPLRQSLLDLPANARYDAVRDVIKANRRPNKNSKLDIIRHRASTPQARKDMAKAEGTRKELIDKTKKRDKRVSPSNMEVLIDRPERTFSRGAYATNDVDLSAGDKWEKSILLDDARKRRRKQRRKAIEKRLPTRSAISAIEAQPRQVYDRGIGGAFTSSIDDPFKTRRGERPLYGDTNLPLPASDIDNTVRRLADQDDSYLSFRRPELKRHATQQRGASEEAYDNIRRKAMEDAYEIERQIARGNTSTGFAGTPPSPEDITRGSTFSPYKPKRTSFTRDGDPATISDNLRNIDGWYPTAEELQRTAMGISPEYRPRPDGSSVTTALSNSPNMSAGARRTQTDIMGDVVNNPEYASSLNMRIKAEPLTQSQLTDMNTAYGNYPSNTYLEQAVAKPTSQGLPNTQLGETIASMTPPPQYGQQTRFLERFPFEAGMQTGAEQAQQTARVEALSDVRNVMSRLKQTADTRSTISELGTATNNMMTKMFGSPSVKALPKPIKT